MGKGKLISTILPFAFFLISLTSSQLDIFLSFFRCTECETQDGAGGPPSRQGQEGLVFRGDHFRHGPLELEVSREGGEKNLALMASALLRSKNVTSLPRSM